METVFGKTKLILEKGDLTKQQVDAIVNPTNTLLMGGGGVTTAIHRAGGRAIAFESRRLIQSIERLYPGNAVITSAGILPATHVIHTVGPIWKKDPERAPKILGSAYWQSLALADKMALKTIAFPSISTGADGYPAKEASQVALDSIRRYLQKDSDLEYVRFVLYSDAYLRVYQETLQEMLKCN